MSPLVACFELSGPPYVLNQSTEFTLGLNCLFSSRQRWVLWQNLRTRWSALIQINQSAVDFEFSVSSRGRWWLKLWFCVMKVSKTKVTHELVQWDFESLHQCHWCLKASSTVVEVIHFLWFKSRMSCWFSCPKCVFVVCRSRPLPAEDEEEDDWRRWMDQDVSFA